MLEAFVRGKLSSQQENMEDLLTSAVFGSLRLLPPERGILPFLSCAIPLSDSENCLTQLKELKITDNSDIKYSFWPPLNFESCYPCEPDVLIEIKPANLLILVEAKLRSPKSSEADDSPWPYDQLAREWDNLLKEAGSCQPILVYLTADLYLPRKSIEDSVTEFRHKRPDQPDPNIYWLSWQKLNQLKDDEQNLILHLKQILQRLDLKPFMGFQGVRFDTEYKFAKPTKSYVWNRMQIEIETVWSFPKKVVGS